jgi:hypothetical protein
MMVDYILENEDLDVFGGPATIDLSVDFGRTGERGSRTWVGNGDPAIVLASQDIKLFDLYINTNAADYSWLYQYVAEIGGPAWVKVLRLNPQQASKISTVTFTSGEATLNIPTSTITSDTTLDASQFIVRYNLENAAGNPVASSFTYSIETISTVKYIQIVINGAEWNGTAWTSLGGDHKVHTFISYLS